MDHRYRGVSHGLIKLGEIPIRRSRDEFKVIVDPYAYDAMELLVPNTLRRELDGWARSYYSLQMHVAAIERFGGTKTPPPLDNAWNLTKQFIRTVFRRMPKVRSLSYLEFDNVKWLPSSAAGYGYVGRKGDNGNYRRAKHVAITIAEKLNHDDCYCLEAIHESTPDVAFTRTQLSLLKVKTKIRNVWGEAFHYVLLEGLFSDPLIACFKQIESFYFIGADPLFAVPALIEELLMNQDYVYTLDWSAFDATVQEWEIRFAFECLSIMLDFPSRVEYQIWRFVIELFIFRKIAGPNGQLYLKTRGLPSGSCFTNILGSIMNYVRIQYMFKRLTDSFATAFTHGDDSLTGVSTTQFVPLERFHEVCEPLGWAINLEKSQVSREGDSTSFLSRSVRESQNYRDQLTCLRMLIFPEYPIPSGSISALRARSICLDAGINSQVLYDIYQYLDNAYGTSEELPFELRSWNLLLFESEKTTAAEYL